MSGLKTLGRYPSLGEVRDYYSRDDFLDFLRRTCEVRRVLFVMPQRKHWEPDPDRDPIHGTTCDELRDEVRERINSCYGGVGNEERLPFYPSFHQSVERWPPGQVGTGKAEARDGVAEADLPSWRDSFSDVLTLLDVLRREGVPHHYKFSGHRSLHLMVPGSGARLEARLFGDSQAHNVQILRMPYSLNEDTGLVSLPLAWDELRAFRPWQACLHVVEVRDDWLTPPTPEEQERLDTFLSGLKGRDAVPRTKRLDSIEELAVIEFAEGPADDGVVDVLCAHLPKFRWREQAAVAGALARLGHPKGLDALIGLSRSDDISARKIAAEALGQWDGPRAVDALIVLLVDPHRKVRPVAADALIRLGETVRPALEEAESTAPVPMARYIENVLNALDVKRRLEAGEEMNNDLLSLIARSHAHPWDMAAGMLRERNDRAEYEMLLSAMADEDLHRRWCARVLLIRIGEPVRDVLESFVESAPEGSLREQVEEIIQGFDRLRDEDDTE